MASAYDFAYLKNLVKLRLQGDDYFTEEMIEDALNEAQDDLVVYTKAAVETRDFTTSPGVVETAFPTDALAVIGVVYNGLELQRITFEEWRLKGGFSNVAQAVLGEPTSYFVRGRNVGLYPTPQSANPAKFVVIPKPTDLDLDGDVPVIPRTFTRAWVHLAVSMLLENDADSEEKAQYHYNRYLELRARNAVNQNESRTRKVRNVMPRGLL